MPYKIAVLCYLYDEEGRLLLLHRRKPPNRDMYSPIGGKLEVAEGEGPHDCALREIREEACVALRHDEIRMISIVSERAYEGEDHWLSRAETRQRMLAESLRFLKAHNPPD
jgi:8-oxo-dGTP diphosphatase